MSSAARVAKVAAAETVDTVWARDKAGNKVPQRRTRLNMVVWKICLAVFFFGASTWCTGVGGQE